VKAVHVEIFVHRNDSHCFISTLQITQSTQL